MHKFTAEYRQDLRNLSEVSSIINGNEGLLSDIFSSVSHSVLSGVKIAGGHAVDGLVTLFKKANRTMILSYGEYKTQFDRALTKSKEQENDEGIKFTKTVLAKLTTTGEVDDIKDSIKTLIDTLKEIDKYRLELEGFYQKELSLFSDYKSVKSTEDAVSLIKKIDELKFPSISLKHKSDTMSKSDVLPGGKVVVYDNSKHTYSIDTEAVTGKESDVMYSNDKVKDLIRQLYDLDEIYRVVSKANDNYIKYLEKFNIVVKDAFAHISGLEGDISTSLLRDLQSRLEGNANVFHFYSGFLPRVMTYVDGVMSTASEFINKQFN